eukprot:4276070-Prymnesium_polylepis.1
MHESNTGHVECAATDIVVYQLLLWRGAAEVHAVVSRIARNSARGTRDGARIHPHAPVHLPAVATEQQQPPLLQRGDGPKGGKEVRLRVRRRELRGAVQGVSPSP